MPVACHLMKNYTLTIRDIVSDKKAYRAINRTPSVTPVDGGCQHLIAERLKQKGFKIEYLDFEDVSNLWAVIGDAGPLFTFVGHTDVVPAGPIESGKAIPLFLHPEMLPRARSSRYEN